MGSVASFLVGFVVAFAAGVAVNLWRLKRAGRARWTWGERP